jgi:hypothetical protein
MRLTDAERELLGDALDELSEGHDRRFEDILWLSFGDRWRTLLGHLVRGGYVELGGSDKDTPRMAPRGHDLLVELRIGKAARAS